MTDLEMKKKINDMKVNIEACMAERYEQVFDIQGQKCFKAEGRGFFLITGLSWAKALVVEHAETEEDARKNMFEDGDLFYIQDMNEKEIIQGMIREIES